MVVSFTGSREVAQQRCSWDRWSVVGLFRQPLNLDWLLDPVGRDEFLGTFRERATLLIARQDASYFETLPGIDSIDEIIATTSPARIRSADDVQLVRTDESGGTARQEVALDAAGLPDVQRIYRAYERGATVVVNAIHRRSAAVARLCRNLKAELHHPVGANFYLTPRDAQGFRCHVDDHDVFVLQLHGSKQWRVGKPSYELPLADSRYDTPPAMVDPVDLLLAAGDVLYIPRGFPHEGATATTSSLHLTVGLHAFCWADLMREALAVVTEQNASLRRGLPPGFLDLPLRPDDPVAAQLAALTDPPTLEAAKSRLAARLLATADVPGEGQFRSIDAITDLDDTSVVTRAPGALCRVRAVDDGSRIEFSGNYVSGPPYLELAFRYVASHNRFLVADLPGDLSPTERVDLIARLVTEGLLRIADEGN